MEFLRRALIKKYSSTRKKNAVIEKGQNDDYIVNISITKMLTWREKERERAGGGGGGEIKLLIDCADIETG